MYDSRSRPLLDRQLHELHGHDLAVSLAEDSLARAILSRAFPDYDEIAGGIRRDRGTHLRERRLCVDAELGTEGSAGPRVPLAEDTEVRAVLCIALPGDHKVAGGIGLNPRARLRPRCVGIDPELRSQRGARGVETPAEDAAIRTILELAHPYDNEVSECASRD